MVKQISAMLTLTGITFKLVKDADGDSATVAELKMVTEDLHAATQLAWFLRQYICADFQATQPTLPEVDQQRLPDDSLEVSLPAR